MGYDKNREQNIASMSFYQNLLTRFVETGEKPVLDTPESDPLTVYLVDTMGDTELRAAVLNSRIAARVFVDTMVQFVSLNLQKANFRFQRSRSELQRIKESASWSVIKRQGAWNALLTELESAYGSLGFERGFYDREADLNGQDDALWESLLIDWRYYYDLRARLDKSTFINERREAQDRLLHTNLKQATRYATANSITEEGFMQTWALMGGRWNTLEFERLYRTTRLQSRYAVLKKIVNRMGRTCDDSGKRRLSVGFGRNESLPYAPIRTSTA